MIYHLVKAEKFIDTFIDSVRKYSNASDQNVFVLRETGGTMNLRNSDAFVHAPLGSRALDDLAASWTSEDQVVIHFLDFATARWLANTKTKCIIHWQFWGGEFFKLASFLDPEFSLRDPKSEALAKSMGYASWRKNNPLYKFSYRIYNHNKTARLLKYYRNVLQRVSKIYHFNRFDVDFVNHVFNLNIEHEYFFYTNLNSFLENNDFTPDTDSTARTSGDVNVLLGNSATLTNNHLDLFDRLPAQENLHIWCPLSYGKKDYAQYIIHEGHKHYGENFHPLTYYMPYANYVELLKKMDVGIMGQNRSQAGGNVLILLLLGKQIYLKSHSTMYKLFDSEGAHVKSIEGGAIALAQQSDVECRKAREKNGAVLRKMFVSDTVERVYKRLF